MDRQSPEPNDPNPGTKLAHLSSSVGHLVINAFSAVVSNAEMLKYVNAQTSPDEFRQLSEDIIKPALDASDIVRRLIDSTKSLAYPSSTDFYLGEKIQSTVSEVIASCKTDVRWQVHCNSQSTIRGCPEQIDLMLRCFLNNAIEAFNDQQDKLIVIRDTTDNSGWTSILIEDTGCGMEQHVQEQASEPFFSTKLGHQGIGLSLATSIWRRHGGTYSITSEPKIGTTIKLSCATPSTVQTPTTTPMRIPELLAAIHNK